MSQCLFVDRSAQIPSSATLCGWRVLLSIMVPSFSCVVAARTSVRKGLLVIASNLHGDGAILELGLAVR